MTTLEAISVIKDMATDLNISPHSLQGEAIKIALNALDKKYINDLGDELIGWVREKKGETANE